MIGHTRGKKKGQVQFLPSESCHLGEPGSSPDSRLGFFLLVVFVFFLFLSVASGAVCCVWSEKNTTSVRLLT